MTRTGKYPEEIRREAVRLVRAHRDEYDSEWAAITSVASKFGAVQKTVHSWVRRAHVDDGVVDGVSISEFALLHCFLLSGTWHELDRRRSRLSAHHGVDEACAVAAILGAVRGVDLVVDAGVGFLHEGDIFLDAAGADTGLVRRLGGADPAAAGRAPTMTIDACISSRRLDGLSVVVRVAPGVRHDPDRVAAEDPPRRWSLLREGDHAEARLHMMPAMRHSARSIVTLTSSL